MQELIYETEKVVGEKIPTEVIPKRSIDLAIPISNPEKAEKELGWKAQRTVKESISNSYKFLSNVRRRETDAKKPKIMHFLPYFPPHSG